VTAALFQMYVEADTRDEVVEAAKFTLSQFPPMTDSTVRQPERVGEKGWAVEVECWWP